MVKITDIVLTKRYPRSKKLRALQLLCMKGFLMFLSCIVIDRDARLLTFANVKASLTYSWKWLFYCRFVRHTLYIIRLSIQD